MNLPKKLTTDIASEIYRWSELDDLMFINDGAVSVNRNKMYAEMDSVVEKLKIQPFSGASTGLTHTETVEIIAELFTQSNSSFQALAEYERNCVVAEMLVQPGSVLYGWKEKYGTVGARFKVNRQGDYGVKFIKALIHHSDDDKPEIKMFDFVDACFLGGKAVLGVVGKRDEIDRFAKRFSDVEVKFESL
ncbi:hypothetical protein [Cronobacter phage vB_Cdu_VP8]|nr:hypothetical protein [Cronobacter phage vB_Cdu_VP8]